MDILDISTSTAVEKASDLYGYFTSLPTDMMIIIGVTLVLFWFATHFGKRSMIAVMLSLYAAYALFAVFPYEDYITSLIVEEIHPLLLSVGVFLVLFIVFSLVIHRVVCAEYTSSGIRRWFEAAILSTVTTAFLLALSYHVFPIEELYDFGAPIDALFATEELFFWWLIVPFFGIFISVLGE
ncbi:hypothetical protein IIB50_01980 [Patescibacteria group bacterium]|nr:hypothetical protein [Patescibacteria group bacterium]